MRRSSLIVLGVLLVACSSGRNTTPANSSGSAATPLASPSPLGGDWAVYHQNNGRGGVSPDQDPLGRVRRAWSSARLDELVYAQPLVVANNVIVATEGNSVYSLNASSGAVVWKTNLGPP